MPDLGTNPLQSLSGALSGQEALAKFRQGITPIGIQPMGGGVQPPTPNTMPLPQKSRPSQFKLPSLDVSGAREDIPAPGGVRGFTGGTMSDIFGVPTASAEEGPHSKDSVNNAIKTFYQDETIPDRAKQSVSDAIGSGRPQQEILNYINYAYQQGAQKQAQPQEQPVSLPFGGTAKPSEVAPTEFLKQAPLAIGGALAAGTQRAIGGITSTLASGFGLAPNVVSEKLQKAGEAGAQDIEKATIPEYLRGAAQAGVTTGAMLAPTGAAGATEKLLGGEKVAPWLVGKGGAALKSLLPAMAEGAASFGVGQAASGQPVTPSALASGAAAGGITQAAIAPVAKGAESLSKGLYQKAIVPTAEEAKPLLKSMAGLSAEPSTRAITAREYGIAGTETGIGVKSLQKANDLWKNTVQPTLKAIDDKGQMAVSFTQDIVPELQKKIEKVAGKDPARLKELNNALGVLKEDFADPQFESMGAQFTQDLKSAVQGRTPQKFFKDKEITNAYGEVRALLGDTLKDELHQGVKAATGVNTAKLYKDWANLNNLAEVGVKSLQETSLKGGAGGLVGGIKNMVVTPIATYGGKALYKTATGLHFVGPAGAGKIGDIISSSIKPKKEE